MRDSVTLPPWMKWLVAHKRLIVTLLFTYPHILEYGSCHFCVRQMAMHLSIASALTPIRPSTKARKGVKCLLSYKNLLRYFLSFLRLMVYRHFSGAFDW